MNSAWYIVKEKSEVAVVFVHGLNSNSTSCWTNRNKVFWPDLFASDPRLPPASIYLANYHTGISSGDYGIQDCCDEMHAALGRIDSQGRPPVLNRKNIIFVCHSMGGIVVRYMLDKYSEDYSCKNIGLCLIASPTAGSVFARWLAPLSWVSSHLATNQLQLGSRFLQDLDGRFALFRDRMSGVLVGGEAIEQRSFLFLNRIVGRSSAGHYFPLRRVIRGTSHTSICKPDSIESPSHQFLVDFFGSCSFIEKKIRPNVSFGKVNSRHGTVEDPLFDVYEERHENFYIVRDVDRKISISSNTKSVWISGPPGVGKTCATKRLSIFRKGRHLHVCMSQCGLDPTRERLIKEVFDSLFDVESMTQKSMYAQVTDELAAGEGGIILYIDEVASSLTSTAAADTLLALLVDIATSCKQRIGTNVTIVVSSVFPPGMASKRSGKTHEIFDFVNFNPWTKQEIHQLICMIKSKVPLEPSFCLDDEALVDAAKGSPRYIKNLFRKAGVYGLSGHRFSGGVLIDEVSREMIADLEYFQ
ncbi:pimeloyl-ACP methyl ester carboxylesterase [Xanthomonas campestris]|uniref:alpha/beta fold hydrolase n=1 Tax=Xanthomonas euroxanthea TaxID=2259622 RepID=UPI001618FC73|nr:alpha/beta hydrolase [Xanthomonas euroxanthea]MBB3777975.1 pimeloyl-ACP methyl ester carboxylesterase [Xanthomonas euroxanthea]